MIGSTSQYTYFSNGHGKVPQIDKTEDYSESNIKQIATYVGVNEESFYKGFVIVMKMLKQAPDIKI